MWHVGMAVSFWYVFPLHLVIVALVKIALQFFLICHVVTWSKIILSVGWVLLHCSLLKLWYDNIENVRMVLKCETVITKSDSVSGIAKCIKYYKVWQTVITKRIRYYKVWEFFITKCLSYCKCDSYYNMRCNTRS